MNCCLCRTPRSVSNCTLCHGTQMSSKFVQLLKAPPLIEVIVAGKVISVICVQLAKLLLPMIFKLDILAIMALISKLIQLRKAEFNSVIFDKSPCIVVSFAQYWNVYISLVALVGTYTSSNCAKQPSVGFLRSWQKHMSDSFRFRQR